MSTITIRLLADEPAALPVLQTWFESEWRSYYGPGGPGNPALDLRRAANRTVLPLGLVAFLNGELCGTAALRDTSIASHRHLGPWIGGLLVTRRHRRRGAGGRLIEEIERLAAGMGYRRLYCATDTARSLLQRRGWHPLPTPPGQGRTTVYVKSL